VIRATAPDTGEAVLQKRNGRFAWRNEALREGACKSLKSLGREIGDFAESFGFNGLIAFLFRAVHDMRSFHRKAGSGRGTRGSG
jgi:hypothetical protein